MESANISFRSGFSERGKYFTNLEPHPKWNTLLEPIIFLSLISINVYLVKTTLKNKTVI